jgi:hypothetical protein
MDWSIREAISKKPKIVPATAEPFKKKHKNLNEPPLPPVYFYG